MRRFARAYGLAAAAFLLLDSTWLSLMGSRLYRPALGHLMREDFDVQAAAAFYGIYLAGVVFFAVQPARDSREALLRGGFLGLACYATYDLTSQAVMKGWPWHVTLVDLAWGVFVTAASAGFARLMSRA